MIKLRAWDHWNDEMIYSDKFDDLYGFFYSVKRREDGENKVTLMLQSKCEDHDNNPIYEGDILQFLHDGLVKSGIVECRPEHFCYWQVKVPGDNFGLERVIGCYSSAYVTGNRYAGREWLEDHGFGALLDEAESEMDRIEVIRGDTEYKAGLQNAVTEAMRRMIHDKLEKEATGPLFIQPGELPEIDPEKEKAAPKPARIESGYNDDFGRKIKEGDILVFSLCGRQLAGEVKHIWSNDRYYWHVWTYESPKLKLSLRHMCEDVACSEVRVIGHISTVRQGGVAVSDIGIQL